MARLLVKQPNGLYTIFSTIVDCPIYWNLTEEDYINLRKEWEAESAKESLAKCRYDISMVKDNFIPNNMTKQEFNKYLQEVGYSQETKE